MDNDELRDDAKVLALSMSLCALMQVLRDRDEQLVARVAHLADDLILDGHIGDDAVKAAAVEYRRKVVFKKHD